MYLWKSQIHTLQPLSGFPRVNYICSEEQFDTSYLWEGKYRTEKTDCLFKYTLAGQGTFRYGDTEYMLTQGSGFLCELSNPKTAYYYPSDAQGPWRFVWIQFNGGGIEKVVRDIVSQFGSIFTLPVSRGIMQKIMSFRSLESDHREIGSAESAQIIYSLLTELAQTKLPNIEDVSGNILVRNARELVNDNPEKNYNVSVLADELKVSREHLTRVFSRYMGITPYDFIIQQKMLFARNLLKETSLSSKEIAARLGFSAPGHFTRTFRKAINMTPIQYRKYGTMTI